MKLKLLQLNIWAGQYLDAIIDYVKRERIDVCTFQEVTGGQLSHDKTSDCFARLSESLPLKGAVLPSFSLKKDRKSYFGNATFINPAFILQKKEVIRLKPFAEVEDLQTAHPLWEKNPYSALSLQCAKNGFSFYIVNTHGAWSPKAVDTPEKIRQGQILFEYLNKLNKPFILAGDFNLTMDTTVLGKYESLASNLSRKFNITNTLNSRIHSAKELFPSGIAVDHVFITKEFKVLNFQVLDHLDISDHLGIRYEVEYMSPLSS